MNDGVPFMINSWRREGNHQYYEMTARIPVIGRIVQLTETPGIPLSVVWFGLRRTTLPSGRIVSIPPMFNVATWRGNGQAYMIVTRIDPFSYEMMEISDDEMEVVMDWATEMVADGIGRFTPSDGGWRWWAK